MTLRQLFAVLTIVALISGRGHTHAQLAAEETRKTVATGVGRTAREALENAFATAVEQTVGTLLDAQTAAKNDRLQEEILTASNGFIKTYETLKQWNSDGLCHCRISAEVELRALREKLAEKGAPPTRFNGANLAARLQTEQRRDEGFAAMLARRLRDLPNRVLRARIDGETVPEPGVTTGTARLKIPVLVYIDRTAYSEATAEVAQVLQRAAAGKWEARIKWAPTQHGSAYVFGQLGGPSELGPRDCFSISYFGSPQQDGYAGMQAYHALTQEVQKSIAHGPRNPGIFTLWQPFTASGSTGVTAYLLEAAAFSDLEKRPRGQLVLTASLCDAGGRELDRSEQPFKPIGPTGMEGIGFIWNPQVSEYRFEGRAVNEVPCVAMSPGLNLHAPDGRHATTAWSGQLGLEVETALLEKVRDVRLSARWEPAAP